MAKSQLFIVALLIVAVTSLQVQQQQTDFAKIETGQLIAMQENGDTWHTVALQNTFSNPVVLMQITSYNGGHPVHIRLRNVMASQFEFKMEEWEYLDEWHTDENINFIVAEAGTYQLACGRQLTVGTIDGVMEQWVNVDFTHDFKTKPVVFSLCQTHNGGDAVVTRTKDITTYDFSVKLKEQEAQDGVHPNAEVVGYFAIEAGHCDGLAAGQTEEEYQHEWKAVPFGKTFKENPLTFVTILSHNGGNTAAIRMTNLAQDTVDVFIEEEQSNDDEQNHVKETLGFLVFEAPNTAAIQLQPKDCCSCFEDTMSCEEMQAAAYEVMLEFDTNNDNQINIGDDIDSDHLAVMANYCDFTNDGSISVCELYECVAQAEQEWRNEHCTCSITVSEQCAALEDPSCPCDGCWSCEDVKQITDNWLDSLDNDNTGAVTLGDGYDNEEIQMVMAQCDQNNDDVVSPYELFECVMQVENDWRLENAPDHGLLYCQNPYPPTPICEGEWNCDDIELIEQEIFLYYNSNDDQVINPDDQIDTEHYTIMAQNCDTNYDGNISMGEICACLIIVENEWRAENCEGRDDLHCDICPCTGLDCPEGCPGEWNCNDITMIVADMMEAYDSNWDGSIDMQDQITDDHYYNLLECDYNGDEHICAWELYECVEAAENAWRDDNCPENYLHVHCQNPYSQETCDCEGSWTCAEISDVTDQTFADLNTDGNMQINAQDGLDYDHMDLLLTNCDADQDNQISKCELYDCIVIVENEWRVAHCPVGYPQVYCEASEWQECCECPGAWECDDVEVFAMDVMAFYDTNVSGSINPEDAIDSEHYNLLLDECDLNNDGNIVLSEVQYCIMQVENDWRAENCPCKGDIYCDFEVVPCCPGEWSCEILLENTEFFFEIYNPEGEYELIQYDNQYMDADHFQLLVDNCDLNADGCLSKNEIFECEVMCENAWRAQYCEEDCQFDIYCANPYPEDTHCEGSWSCAQIELYTEQIFGTVNTNGDAYINIGDEVDAGHLQLLLDECDTNNDNQVDQYEIFNCLQKVENEWRQENCATYCESYCPNPFTPEECPGEWTCADIESISYEVIAYYDTNSDVEINLQDDIPEDHYIILVQECDYNNDGTVSPCEVFECVMQVENDWRDINCPQYGDVYCEVPAGLQCEECEGGLSCEEISVIVDAFFENIDFDGNNTIDFADYENFQTEEQQMFFGQCWDFSNDGTYQKCDVYECFVSIENQWREMNCPNSEPLYCDALDYYNEEFDCPHCDGAMTCIDLYQFTSEYGISIDSESDMNINYGDMITEEHLDYLMEICDANNDQNITACELYECIRQAENSWRAENCPARFGENNCPCPYTEYECEGAWDCNDVTQVAQETIWYYDTNADMNINLEDAIEEEHYQLLLQECDQDNDGTVDACELFDCVVATENDWRLENCSEGFGLLYCECPFDDVVCVGAWNCDDVESIAATYIAELDTNGDGSVNYGDNLNAEHLDFVLSECDMNQDGSITYCEALECVIDTENAWRAEYCPDSEPLFCDIPDCVCPGYWTCDDMAVITEDFFATYDNNLDNDQLINYGDNIEAEHLDILLSECDQNQDGSVCRNEFYDCLVNVENEWRLEACPEFGLAYCQNPYLPCECPGMWTCDDIAQISMEMIALNDTNGDQVINPEDSIDADHYAMLVASCDYNNDGSIDCLEVHDCVIQIENDWRDENCPEYGHAHCEDICVPSPCPGGYSCQELIDNTEESFQYFDTNGDGQLNVGDNIIDEHLEFMLENCDMINQNGAICRYEFFECALMVENQWRQDQECNEDLYCINPYQYDEVCECAGEWTCEDIAQITENVFADLDSDNDMYITLNDQIDADHFSLLAEACDANGDEAICQYEIFECIVLCENAWRAEYCVEGYSIAYCPNPYDENCECQGSMTCADIELAVMDVLYYYDTDASGYITPADNVDMEHYDLMIAGCDSDNDGNIDPCEIHACILQAENEWRAAACPNFPLATCDCEGPYECPGEWNCDDILVIAGDFYNVYNTNGDEGINYGDDIDEGHYEIMMQECDFNNDGVITECEVFDCIVIVENQWRIDACPANYPPVYCEWPYDDCVECEGSWNCEQIMIVAQEIYTELDTNQDGMINLGDEIDAEHFDLILSECDSDNDGDVCQDELFDCVQNMENEYRMAYCPDFPLAACPNPMPPCQCEGAWTCIDIENITVNEMAYYDSNLDGVINPEDNMDAGHYAYLVENCDFNNDGTISYCEMHQCTLNIENQWREDNCPDYGAQYCSCSEVPPCPGAMSCADITFNTEEAMAMYDTNGDDYISDLDDMVAEHLALIVDQCDLNGDAMICKNEVFECLVESENVWRADLCPDAELLYCENPYESCSCPGIWTCDNIDQIAIDMMATADENQDGQINLGDDIDQEHYDILMQDCDINGDGTIEGCEIWECVQRIENEWRAEYCPTAPEVDCPYCPFEPIPCEGAWSCADMDAITIEMFAQYNTNGDYVISPEDGNEEHFQDLEYVMDLNDDGNVDACEIHEYVMEIERQYRQQNCEGYGAPYCVCPIPPVECEAASTCTAIIEQTEGLFDELDTNFDGQINMGDNIDSGLLQDVIAYCDLEMNDSVDRYELHECLVNHENEVRAQECGEDFPTINCPNPYVHKVCEGAWTCDDVAQIAQDDFNSLNTNGDNQINSQDNIDEAHLQGLLDTCDFNNDGVLEICEIEQCILNVENAWRTEYCPEYGYLYCEIPSCGCEGVWSCDDIDMITYDVFTYYNTNGDQGINPEDEMSGEQYQLLLESCDGIVDGNLDGTIDICEIYQCVVVCENAYRAEYCPPDYAESYCECPYTPPPCEGGWNCPDLFTVTEEFMAVTDSNGDGQINAGDEIGEDHLALLLACDQNGDGSVCYWEAWECALQAENEWRAQACPDAEPLFCNNPYNYDVCYCEGHWSCTFMAELSTEVFEQLNTDDNEVLDSFDGIDADHLSLLQDSCDANGDGMIDRCEIYDCIVECENVWRDANCPEYGHAYCLCPFTPPTCEGAWTCEDIHHHTLEVIASYDTNGDGVLNPEDMMNNEHYTLLLESCDQGFDGSLSYKDIHDCVLITENEWRDEYCPDYGNIECPVDEPPCDGAWNCADIIMITEDFMAYNDTDMDGNIDLGDNIDAAHLDFLLTECDGILEGTEADGQVCEAEIFECVRKTENDWRDNYCPEYPHLYCYNPYPCPGCFGAWTCEDVYEKAECLMSDYDSNGDGYINMADAIDPSHMELLNDICDQDNSGSLNSWEVFDCLVMAENEWRADNCPEYGDLICENPYTNITCEGAWNCEQIEEISLEIFTYYNTNGNNDLDLGDYIESEHFELLLDQCDTDFNGSIEFCELEACVETCENQWRQEYCPEDFGYAYCNWDCEYEECEGEWNCPDVVQVYEEIMIAFDTNNDGQLNLGDGIEADHLDLLMTECDYDQDGTINGCEVFQCVVDSENAWRLDNCEEGYAPLNCEIPTGPCPTCPGKWTCEDIMNITAEFMAAYDVTYDGYVNGLDTTQQEHFFGVAEMCDLNQDGALEACEVYECVMMYENEWRDVNCPEYGYLYCENPFPCVAACPGAWTCDEVEQGVLDMMYHYDLNGDGVINPADMYADEEHIQDLTAMCDFDNDGSIEACELHACVMDTENAFRTEYCPDWPQLYCECIDTNPGCPGEWNCYDIEAISADVMMSLDSNEDGAVNLGDNIDNDHLDILLEQCDFNGDGTLTNCEIFYCVEECENAWRLDYCPEGYQMLFCDAPFVCTTCEQAYTCDDMKDQVDAAFAELDINQDGQLNLGDMDEAHFANISLCDLNADETITMCEAYECVVMMENEWRAENCPGFGDAFCENPYECECAGAWECPMIEQIAAECIAYYDTNLDGVVNPQDDMDFEHAELLSQECDLNNDGTLEACEIHACVVMVENAWRAENCPYYGDAYCYYECEPVCEGAWNCDDVIYVVDDIFASFNTNGDEQLNLGDNIEADHYEVLMYNCDTNQDGDVSRCELFDCVVVTENEWRADYCPDAEPLYCNNFFEPCVECQGYWTCDDIYNITVDYMTSFDSNGDGQINYGDEIEAEHLAWLQQECDFNYNETLDQCEIYECIVMVENDWRAEVCPDYGFAYCDCPFVVITCEGAWECSDIEAISLEVIAFYDTNSDEAINPQDDITEEHYIILVDQCDTDNDGTVDACEVHACVVIVENEWRDAYCPDYGYVYCPCPFDDVVCEGAWNCDDILYITVDFMEYNDTNNDGQVNYGDYVDDEHLEILFDMCDTNGNGSVDSYEAFECVVKCENEWRVEYCPDAEPVYCPNPFTQPQCDGAWTCEDIYNISVETIASYDMNGDGNINVGDIAEDQDGTHVYYMMSECDFNGDDNVDSCEVHECIVKVENDWRAEYCPDYGMAYCDCPFSVAECPGHWDCDEIELISIEILDFYESSMDYAINPADAIDEEHYNILIENCDLNNDGTIDACEVHTCVLMVENEWRAEVCPDFGFAYCDCPFYVVPCEGAWNCYDVTLVTDDIMVQLDTNYDGQISASDNLDQDHLDMLVQYCDVNGDNVLSVCEVFDCVVMAENEWRHENCLNIPDIYCTCPFTDAPAVTCDGAWDCEDIMMISTDILNYYDTNYDGTISLEDEIDPAHLEEINSNCDFDNNGVTDACEVHQCIVIIENDWRDEYCPGYGHVYCDCPFEVAECEGAWNCEDIANISIEVLNIYDTNYDGSINLEDEIETEHYDILTEYCDYNNDGTIDSCEVHSCIVDCENAWRDEYCPDYGHIYCDCPFYVPSCDGAWNCDDIYAISVEMINAYDTDNNGTINLQDEIDPSHYDVLVEYCDVNGDGEVDSCETHSCIVMIENEWRDEYCPDSEHVYCDCPF